MNSSFYNGINGITSSQYGIDVLSDNIANVNTVGYKESTAEFSTLFSTSLTDSYFDSTSNDIGLGSKVGSTTTNMNQGIFQTTDNAFDLAIGGEGWFGVQSTNNQTYYTRAGDFGVDSNGDLVDSNGNYLLGTSANNITATTLSQDKLEQFGVYYGKDGSNLGEAFAISDIDDIALSSVDTQSKINLPDILYYPPVPTSNVSFSANLDPKIIEDVTQININENDIVSTTNNINQTLSIDGTVSNTSEILDPKSGDVVLVTISDALGNSIDVNSTLDENLNWNITDADISSLDVNSLNINAKLQTVQEIPNVEHFTSTIISPSGEKDILDMTYTKRVPQQSTGNTWDGKIEILSYYEDYIVEMYDPTKIYDPALYDVDINKGTVVKTYDPNIYKIDTTTNQVYEIIDSQNATLNFGGTGELLDSTIPTLSNGGTPLTLDLGTPNSFEGFVSNVDLDKANVESHDGYVEGYLKGYSMDSRGNVIAEFDNGRSVPISKVAVYHFQNDQGLNKVDSTLFSTSSNSGNPIFYTDENGNTILGSQIYSNNLENSNVDLTTALTELIVMQKAFDASSKSITTSDEMIQNAINMKK
jgi:flagellar hook protein FlgE